MSTWPAPPAPPSRRRRSSTRWLVIVLAVVAAVGAIVFMAVRLVGPALDSATGKRATPAVTTAAGTGNAVKPSTTKVVTATDRQSRVAVPKSWKKMELVDDGVIEVGDKVSNQYLIVLTERKADLDMDLRRFSRVVIASLTEHVTSKQLSAPTSLRVGGRPALQVQIRGTINGIRVVYWHTSVEGVRNYHQVIAWTVASQEKRDGPKLRQIISSFREIT